jgi:5'-3' exonuclease
MQRLKLIPKLDDEITLVVDGRFLAYRTMFSQQKKLSYQDRDTGMLFGFFKTLQSIANRLEVTNTVIMYDVTKTVEGIRREEFEGYKVRELKFNVDPKEIAQRKQFELDYHDLMVMSEKLGFAIYTLPKYEADDGIALFCKRFGGQKIIATRDEDMYQLINEDTMIFDPSNNKKKDLKWFMKEYGISPEQWTEYKAIAGCKSDTVPGVPGMGEKRTLDYLKNKNKKWGAKIKKNQELYDMCYNLVVLPHATLNGYEMEWKKTKMNEETFIDFCQAYGFNSFLNELHNFYIFMKGGKTW